MSNKFLELGHARWLNDSASDVVGQDMDHPVPDPPSDINKLLNSIECDDMTVFLETLMSMVIDDWNITETVRKQDCMSKTI